MLTDQFSRELSRRLEKIGAMIPNRRWHHEPIVRALASGLPGIEWLTLRCRAPKHLLFSDRLLAASRTIENTQNIDRQEAIHSERSAVGEQNQRERSQIGGITGKERGRNSVYERTDWTLWADRVLVY